MYKYRCNNLDRVLRTSTSTRTTRSYPGGIVPHHSSLYAAGRQRSCRSRLVTQSALDQKGSQRLQFFYGISVVNIKLQESSKGTAGEASTHQKLP